MTITITKRMKDGLMAGLAEVLTVDRLGLRFDAMRIEDDEEEGSVRVVFALGGKDVFFYLARGCRLTGGDIAIRGIEGSAPMSLTTN